MALFSSRQGIIKEKTFQLQEMDEELKNSLWNALDIFFWSERKVPRYTGLTLRAGYFHDQPLKKVIETVWMHHLKQPLDKLGKQWNNVISKIRSMFYMFEWYEVYDFIEFIAPLSNHINQGSAEKFTEYCNVILERERSAYRFVNGLISPITNKQEINELQQAASTDHDTVNAHMICAMEKLSDKKSPDYRNSIKEAISAVESAAKLIAGSQNATLADALKQIKEKIGLHSALEQGFQKIYAYTSDSQGIRHSLMDKEKLTFDDAKFMVVSCSAFVNYLLAKAREAKILK